MRKARKKMVYYILGNLDHWELRHFSTIKRRGWCGGFDFVIYPNKVKVIVRNEELTTVGYHILNGYLKENKLKACKFNIQWILDYRN